MKIVNFGQESVTVELAPADCFLLAEACTGSIRYDHTTNITLTEALAAVFTAADMAAAATFHGATDGFDLAQVRKEWMPTNDRYVH